ncbi:MAG: TolC family protein, partial [Pirellulaceae bacterium]|nr:TolC family protein [Pirellulaceae bacterium]
MTRHISKPVALMLVLLLVATGCHPTQPFYLHEDGDLSHLIETATDIDYPDVETAGLPDARQPLQPYSLTNTDFQEFWDLSLEECISIALQNTKFVRRLPQTDLLGQAARNLGINGSASVYLPAITETDPNSGVAQALSAFDAQVATSLFWETTDRPLNRTPQGGQPLISERNGATFLTELSKRNATGGQAFFRSRLIHEDANNSSTIFDRPVRTTWETNLEAEVRQPLLRGRGAAVNRAPVLIARINTDISIAEFEAGIRNMVLDIEKQYWSLYCAYRRLETAKVGRDAALATWKRLAPGKGEVTSAQDEANARARYFVFRSLMESALSGTGTDFTLQSFQGTDQRGLFESERILRHLMGLAPTDGRLIRPMDEPTLAKVDFDWHEVLTEGLVRDPNLRQQKWSIKRSELVLLQARNQLLPQVDAVALYRWLGVGDHLANGNPPGANFPNLQNPGPPPVFGGSSAIEEMLEGNYQEGRIGVQMTMPVGFRRELANVRNAQLQLAREHALLDELELDLSHSLSTSIRSLDVKAQLAQTNFNRWKAAYDEVQSLEPLVENGLQPVNLLLDALQRRAEAQISFYTAVCDYNIAIADVHFRKGSLLEYDNVLLAEGPWPKKAYWDAMERARERDASHYLDYGWTRPSVISRGQMPQHGLPQAGAEFVLPPGATLDSAEQILTPTPADPATRPEESIPQPGTRMTAPLTEVLPDSPAAMLSEARGLDAAQAHETAARPAAISSSAGQGEPENGFAWGNLGLQGEARGVAPATTAMAA